MGDDLQNSGILPSERADKAAEAKKQAQKLRDLSAKALYQDFTKTFGTAHGKRVLAWIFTRSGFGKSILSASARDGVIDPLATTIAAQDLNFYIAIRDILPLELIQEIEDDRRIQPSGTIERTSTGEQPITRVTSTGRTSKSRTSSTD